MNTLAILLRAGVIFIICYRLQPNHSAFARIVSYGNVRHLHFRRCAVPVFDVGATDDRLSFVNGFDRLSFLLIKPFTVDDDQSLSCGMCMPIASRAWLERHAAEGVMIAFGFLCQPMKVHRSCKIIRRCSFAFRENTTFVFVLCGFHFSFLRIHRLLAAAGRAVMNAIASSGLMVDLFIL